MSDISMCFNLEVTKSIDSTAQNYVFNIDKTESLSHYMDSLSLNPAVGKRKRLILSPISLERNKVKRLQNFMSGRDDLIGDFSKAHILPVISSSQEGLRCISAHTMKSVLEGQYDDVIDSYKIIDTRYPYEFEGGHIKGAINLYTRGHCLQLLDESARIHNERHIIIFYCESSKERGPNMARRLRKADRAKNVTIYPLLNYPEIYVLEGGYKEFFQQFSIFCFPMEYKKKLDPMHLHEMKHFEIVCSKETTSDASKRRRKHSRKDLSKAFE